MVHQWRRRGLLVPFVLGLVALTLVVTAAPGAVRAGDITFGDTNVRSEDPRSIRFSTRVNTSAGLASAEFVFVISNPDGNIGGSGQVGVSPGAELDLVFELQTINAQRYIPVGSEISYHWEVTDEDGDTQRSPEGTFTFLDGRFDWQQITEDGVTVFYYSSREHGERALQATHAGLNEVERLLQVEVPYPVKVVVWRNEGEGELAQRPRGNAFDARVITGGSRVSPDLLHVYDALSSFTDVVRHEAAHIVTHVAGDGPFAQVPAWLDEGTAVYAQSAPGGYLDGVNFAIQTDTTFRLRSINSSVNEAQLVNQFYGQSWSTVDHLIDRYGEERFAELFATIFEGADIEAALEAVYGFDSDALYNEWREEQGLAPTEFAAIEDGSFAPTDATVAPLGVPTPLGSAPPSAGGSGDGEANGGAAAEGEPDPPSTGDAAADDGGGSSGLIVLVIAAVVALVLGGGAFALLRRPGAG